jgi:hypothetical protein
MIKMLYSKKSLSSSITIEEISQAVSLTCANQIKIPNKDNHPYVDIEGKRYIKLDDHYILVVATPLLEVQDSSGCQTMLDAYLMLEANALKLYANNMMLHNIFNSSLPHKKYPFESLLKRTFHICNYSNMVCQNKNYTVLSQECDTTMRRLLDNQKWIHTCQKELLES